MIHAPQTEHRTNWLLASLDPAAFAALEPRLTVVALTLKQVLYEAGDLSATPTFLTTPWCRS